MLEITLNMYKILEAQDMLESFSPVLRTIAKYVLRIRPGYFRLVSDFKIQVRRAGKSIEESGKTLHEIVLFKPVQEEFE